MVDDATRHLILSADERTWKTDKPVIFLGEWCCLYDRKHVWSKMDYVVASPYGLGQVQKDKDYIKSRSLEEEVFPVICELLNQYHGRQYSLRSWRIILGHWLRDSVKLLLNRINTIEQCMQNYQISGTTVLDNSNYSMVPQDYSSAVKLFDDDRWNDELFIRIINLDDRITCPVEVRYNKEYDEPIKVHKKSFKEYVFFKFKSWAAKIGSLFVRDNDGFIITSYLPRKENIKLHMSLGMMPIFKYSSWLKCSEKVNNKQKKEDNKLRDDLSRGLVKDRSNQHNYIIRSLIFKIMPVCYLEDFMWLNENVDKMPWQKNPKFIFTSNSFASDEVFKLWTAKKVESGTLYVVGQHGNNYGTHRYYTSRNSIEEITSDKFLTWGWSNDPGRYIPAFVLKTVGCKGKIYDPYGGLLLVELHMPHRIETSDCIYEFNNYFEEQKVFVRELDIQPKNNLTVRLHGSSSELKWNELDRWREFDRFIVVDQAKKNIDKLIRNSRVSVFSYDSTGMLECLNQNIPCIAFWQNNLEHLRDHVKSDYQLLIDVGIIHLSPQEAARKVNDVWGDIENWWLSDNVQIVRKTFCDKYARTSQFPVSEIKKHLVL